MPISLDEPTALPRYQRMARQIVALIWSGELQPGDRLPSFGEMKTRYGATQNTVERVYVELEKKGLIRREAKRGVFVAEPRAPVKPLLEVVASIDLRSNEYYLHILKGIQEEAHRRQAEILLRHEDAESDWDKAAGVIVLSSSRTSVGAIPSDMPRVAVLHNEFTGIPKITVDDESGIAALVAHLVSLGHRRIGYLSVEKVPTERSKSRRRLDAYRKALSGAGIALDPRWERPLRESGYEPPREFVELGREKMGLWLLDNWLELRCTALLAQNDETAIGAMQAMRAAGIRVPEEVSVAGFDGIGAGTLVTPRLTTIGVPLEAVGAAAVTSVLEQIHRKSQGRKIVLPVELIVRESTARAPKGAEASTSMETLGLADLPVGI